MKARSILVFALLGACSSAAQSPSGGATSDATVSSTTATPSATAAATSDAVTPKDPMLEVAKVVRPLELDVVLRDPAPGRSSRPKGGEPEKGKDEKKKKKKGNVIKIVEIPVESPDDGTPAPDAPAPPADGELSASTHGLGSSVEPEAVRGVIEESRAVFRACSDADASVVLDFTIAPSGDVADVASSSSEPDDVRLRDCVVSAFRKLRFAPMASTESAKVSLRLALRSE